MEERPHLCLFAIKKILPGQELLYDYGPTPWPWRKQVKSCNNMPELRMLYAYMSIVFMMFLLLLLLQRFCVIPRITKLYTDTVDKILY